ncbi:MAG TPA: hypothetical protein VNJ01_03255 [Bacteriovoracaceae bacterium]|nr:hypothetical protein [Bacteriovoracaceae bacterium]
MKLFLLLIATVSISAFAAEKEQERLKNCLAGRIQKVETEKSPDGKTETSTYHPVDCFKMAKEIAADLDAKAVVQLALTVGREHNWASSIPLYKIALTKGATCQEEGLTGALRAALDTEPAGQVAADAKWIAFDKCKKESQKSIVEGLSGMARESYYRKNSCDDLLKNKAIGGLNAKLCKI